MLVVDIEQGSFRCVCTVLDLFEAVVCGMLRELHFGFVGVDSPYTPHQFCIFNVKVKSISQSFTPFLRAVMLAFDAGKKIFLGE